MKRIWPVAKRAPSSLPKKRHFTLPCSLLRNPPTSRTVPESFFRNAAANSKKPWMIFPRRRFRNIGGLSPWLEQNSGNTGQALNVRARQPLTPDQLSNMVVSGLTVSPSPGSDSPTVQLQLSAEQPMVLTGRADDLNVRQVLTYMVENSERFDAGVRLDCLDVLKAAVRDQQVRLALLNAARKDQNPAVRMKALEALRDATGEDDVRQVLLDALEHDSNPGVRVEAVNLLVGSLDNRPPDTDAAAPPEAPAVAPAPAPGEDASFEHVVKVLQELQRRDPNPYVRLRSAAALRQIGPREMQ